MAVILTILSLVGCQTITNDPSVSPDEVSDTKLPDSAESATDTDNVESDTTEPGDDIGPEYNPANTYNLYISNGSYGRVYTVVADKDSGTLVAVADYGTVEYDGSYNPFEVGGDSNIDIAYAVKDDAIEFRVSNFGNGDSTYLSEIRTVNVDNKSVDFTFENGELVFVYGGKQPEIEKPPLDPEKTYILYFTNGAYGRVYTLLIENESGNLTGVAADYGTVEFDGSFDHFAVGADSNVDISYTVKGDEISFQISRYGGEDCSNMETAGGQYLSAISAMKVNDKSVRFKFENGALVLTAKRNSASPDDSEQTPGDSEEKPENAYTIYFTNGAYGRVYTVCVDNESITLEDVAADYGTQEFDGSFGHFAVGADSYVDVVCTVNGHDIEFRISNFGNEDCSDMETTGGRYFSAMMAVSVNDESVDFDFEDGALVFTYHVDK